MDNYELAFRMQMEVPETIDISKEDEKNEGTLRNRAERRQMFLAENACWPKTGRTGRAFCAGLFRWLGLTRLSGACAHGSLIRSIDKPITGLIKDLKRRGMLDETLVIWSGEFGRSPDNGIREGGIAYGRDHNAQAMNMWFAGGWRPCRAYHRSYG